MKHLLLVTFVALALYPAARLFGAENRSVPDRVPPKRSSQIENGFGINSDLPRPPYLPWDRRWWTRMFDAGVSWIRIGQYENSSDYTSWDWVEQKRGVYTIAPQLDDYVDSLVDNGVKIQVQLHYGNPMYTSPSGQKPDSIVPEPGAFHNPDRGLYSVFWPPTTPDQIEAFVRYAKFVVNHFRGRIHYYALWNEQDIDYWNPIGDPEEYGRLLKAFVTAVHGTDPQARVIYGGQADPVSEFARRALDACQCASGIDIFAYHTYPGYGRNLNPESMDYGAYGPESPRKLRTMVKNYPGIRKDIQFWDDEFNSIPSWTDSDESVQSKYIPRGLIYNWAAGVRTFVWLLTAGTDGNEYDDFGLIHGLRNLPDDFTPRPAFFALQNTNALFSDTNLDANISVTPPDLLALRRQSEYPFFAYGFRSQRGKAIVAYWIGAHSLPGNTFPPLNATLKLENTGIQHPVLIDVVSGQITTLSWKKGTSNELGSLPVKDSVLAIADASYFDWLVLPETPSSLQAARNGAGIRLAWEIHAGNPHTAILERRKAGSNRWEVITKQPSGENAFIDRDADAGLACYRVRVINAAGQSAYSNVARVR